VTLALSISYGDIEDFCRRHRIRRLALFGSALREDFGPDSDVDVLVEFEPEQVVRLDTLLAAEAELSAILGRPVDLGERRSVEEDPNYLRRRHILGTAQVIYER
jgi:hypothetical protein